MIYVYLNILEHIIFISNEFISNQLLQVKLLSNFKSLIILEEAAIKKQLRVI